MQKTILAISLFIAILSTSCRQEKARIANYYVRYMQNEQQYQAEVSIGEGKDSLNITHFAPNDGVKFNGYSMKLNQGSKPFFQSTEKLEFSPKCEFTYKDSDQEEHVFNFNIMAVDSFAFVNDISKEKGGKLTLYGKALQGDESLVLIFTDNDNQTASINIQQNAGNDFVVSGRTLANLTNGDAQVYMVRTKTQISRPNDNEIETATSEFFTKTTRVNITD